MPTEAQLVDALTRADAAGDTQSAQQFAGMIRQMRQSTSTYQVTAPDGTRYQITAPAGATQDQVLAYAQQQHARTGVPIIAESADGVQHQFPAGTSQSVIDRVMKNYALSKAPKSS